MLRSLLSIAATIVLLICLANGCAVPLRHQRIDHVKAIGWDANNRPVALAQEMEFDENFVFLEPDGGMETKQSVQRGAFVLITPDGRERLNPEILENWDKKRCELKLARWSSDQNRFLTLISVNVGPYYETEEAGFTIDTAGRFEQFYLSERHADYDISPDGRDLYRLWYRKDAEGVNQYPVYERIDASTGDIDGYESPLWRVQIKINNLCNKPDWLPCLPEHSNLSPDGDRLVTSCIAADSCSIWVIEADQEIHLLATVPVSEESVVEYRHSGNDWEELKSRYLYNHCTLAWSPGQSRIYFCQGPGADGYVIDATTGEWISRSPGLLAAAWSPDGKAIAGIVDGKLFVWRPDAVPED